MVIAMLGTTRSEWPSVITMKGAANDATSWMTLAMVSQATVSGLGTDGPVLRKHPRVKEGEN